MNTLSYIAIIPARYASTRFPGKPLAMLEGKTVIERVYSQVTQALDNVVVATDDTRIADAVNAFGGTVVLTRSDHRSGTDRCFEAYNNIGSDADVVINVQGDEPFISPDQIKLLMSCFDNPRTDIATLVRRLDPDGTFEELANPNMAKVVIDNNGRALYFSRSVMPYIRNCDQADWPRNHPYLAHIGLYAYRADILRQVTALPPSPLEIAESLEQLRWLQNGFHIQTAVSDHTNIGIDTPDDLQRAIQYLKQQH